MSDEWTEGQLTVPKRCLKIFDLSEEFLFEWLRKHANNLPSGAKLEGIHYYPDRRSFGIKASHDTFPFHEEGTVIVHDTLEVTDGD